MLELIVTPSGHFRLEGDQDDVDNLGKAFAQSRADGLMQLARRVTRFQESASLSFWQDYANAFMRSCCAFAETDPLHIPIDHAAVVQYAEALPPMKGAEYVSPEWLEELWQELEAHVQAGVQQTRGGARQYIASEFPHWRDVGKIHFHLAENRNPHGKPFAFLTTYSVRVAGKARVQHRPLGAALQDSLRQQQTKQLQQLLGPIHEASRHSEFLREKIESRGIYAPLYLDPEEAFRFIRDIPHCENAGIVCKVPNWWDKGRPPKVKVGLRVGTKAQQSHVGFEQLLDFDVGISVGGTPLSKAEWQKLMAADGPLVELGGKWVEVDKRRIEQMLSAWEEVVSTSAGEGISFAQAMRLVAGFGLDSESERAGASVQGADKAWVEVIAGKAFTNLLKQLRQPENQQSKAIDKVLRQHLKGTLRPYQNAGLDWLKTVTQLKLGGCLADDMGLGKTIQVLAALLVLKHHLKVKQPSLLVVPASLLGNWQAELERFAPSLTYRTLHSSADDRNDRVRLPKDVDQLDLVITTYGMVLRTDWLKKKRWHLVVADEAQAIKNARTKQSQAMRSLQAATKIAMTGTPVENSLADLWSIFDFACPGLLGNEAQFKQAVKAMCAGETEGPGGFAPLRQLIAPYILRRKKTDKTVISDLPEKIEMVATCYLTTKQASLYQKQVDYLAKALAEAETPIERKGLVLASLMKFKQICNHPSQYRSDNSYVPALSGKFQKLKELVETIAAREEKVLVFTQFRELTDILAHYLGECFGRDGLIIHGGTPVKKRQQLVDQFQAPGGPPFFVLSLKAGGTGLNLTAASHVIHFDRWWNPAVENQATDRAFRIGQKKNVLVHKLVCKGTVEEKIDQMIASKQELADALVEGGKEVNLTELSDEDLLRLVSLDIQRVGGMRA